MPYQVKMKVLKGFIERFLTVYKNALYPKCSKCQVPSPVSSLSVPSRSSSRTSSSNTSISRKPTPECRIISQEFTSISSSSKKQEPVTNKTPVPVNSPLLTKSDSLHFQTLPLSSHLEANCPPSLATARQSGEQGASGQGGRR